MAFPKLFLSLFCLCLMAGAMSLICGDEMSMARPKRSYAQEKLPTVAEVEGSGKVQAADTRFEIINDRLSNLEKRHECKCDKPKLEASVTIGDDHEERLRLLEIRAANIQEHITALQKKNVEKATANQDERREVQCFIIGEDWCKPCVALKAAILRALAPQRWRVGPDKDAQFRFVTPDELKIEGDNTIPQVVFQVGGISLKTSERDPVELAKMFLHFRDPANPIPQDEPKRRDKSTATPRQQRSSTMARGCRRCG